MLSLLLVLHILAAATLMGHLTTAAFWKKRADRSGNPEQMAATAQALGRADFTFTGPSLAVLLITGIWMGGLTGWERFQEPWLAISFLLLIVIVILWLAALRPLHRRLARQAQEGVAAGGMPPAYQKSSKIWEMVNGIATLLPLVILILMVVKPGLPSP